MRNLIIILIGFFFFSLLTYCSGRKKNSIAEESPFLNQHDSVQYVGMETCRQCHSDKFDTYIHTGMGLSFDYATKKKSAGRFAAHDFVYDSLSNFYYKPFWKNDTLYMHEYRLYNNDTIHSRTEKIDYIIGSGQHTNSHMLSINGYVYQAPITFYTQKQKWDMAPGMEAGFNARFSRVIETECITCHNGLPQAVAGSVNKYITMPQGIDCERCHGPGALHVAQISKGIAVDTSRETDYTIVNPRNLSVELQNELCFRCHLQGVNVLNDGASFFDFKPGDYIRDHWNVFLPAFDGKNDQFLMASQADRMVQSKCFIESKQISCITCHNPHITVKQTPVAQFNAPCMQCHNQNGCAETIAARNLVNDNCSGCHIPKSGSIDIPHVSISDHKIQIPGKEKQKAEGKFIGLKAITDPNASPLTMAKGYLQYYEVFTHQRVMLDSASMWLNMVKKKDDAYLRTVIHLHYLQGEFKNLIQQSQLIKQMDTQDAWTYYRIGESYLALENNIQALEYFQRAVNKLPYNLDFNLKLGSAQFLAGNTKEAEKIFSFIVTENPKFEKAWMNLGSVYALQGNYNEAEAAYKNAIALNPDYLQARLSLTDMFIKTRQKQKANAMLDYLLQFYPEDVFVKKMGIELNKM